MIAAKKSKNKIVYPVVPSRLKDDIWRQILDFIRQQGCTPFDHRRGAPFEDFELCIGRNKTLAFLIEVMKICDAIWVFGISEGVMGEFKAALDMNDAMGEKRIEILGFYGFDPEWEKYYNRLKPKYGDLIARLRGKFRLIALVGPRAVGKTFWTDALISFYGNRLARIRNTTTRQPRDDRDRLSYNFISEEEFRRGIAAGYFLEHDIYHDVYYGSSMNSILETLADRHGIFAITPSGAQALYNKRFRINLSIIFLRVKSEAILRRNLTHRGIIDRGEQEKLLQEARQFTLAEDIEHQVIELTGDVNIDEQQLLSAIDLHVENPTRQGGGCV